MHHILISSFLAEVAIDWVNSDESQKAIEFLYGLKRLELLNQ